MTAPRPLFPVLPAMCRLATPADPAAPTGIGARVVYCSRDATERFVQALPNPGGFAVMAEVCEEHADLLAGLATEWAANQNPTATEGES